MRRFGVLASILFVLIGCAWALSSPVGASPDDEFHLASTWCAWGDRPGACVVESTGPRTVSVPTVITQSPFCLGAGEIVGGYCTEQIPLGMAHGVTRVNDRLYPDLYYKVTGLLVGTDVTRSVMVIRMFNVLLAGLLLLGVFLLAPTIQRRSYLLSFSVLSIPLGLFMISSTNPTSWTFTGAAGFWLYLLLWQVGVGRDSRSRLLLIGVGLVISAAMLVGARADGALLAVFEIVVVSIVYGPVLSSPPPSRSVTAARLAPVVVVGLAAVAVIASTGQLSRSARGSLGTPARFADESSWYLLTHNLMDFPSLILGVVGGSPLGWLDTEVPVTVLCVGALSLGALALMGLMDLWTRKALALAALLVPLVVFPLAVLQQGRLVVGEGVQARYLMPALVAFVGVLLLTRESVAPWRLRRAHAVAFVIALTASGSVAFFANFARYASDPGHPERAWTLLPWSSRTATLVVAALSLAFYWLVARSVSSLEPSGIEAAATVSAEAGRARET